MPIYVRLVGETGIEPATSRSQTARATNCATLRVCSLTNCSPQGDLVRLSLDRQLLADSAGGGTRTRTRGESHEILSLGRLPFRHPGANNRYCNKNLRLLPIAFAPQN